MTLRQAAQAALDALMRVCDEQTCHAMHHKRNEYHMAGDDCPAVKTLHAAKDALRAALAQPEPYGDEEDACPTCGEDGGTSCGVPGCGLLTQQPKPHNYTWTKLELEAIQQYDDARVAAETAALRKAATNVVRVWNSPSWNWSHEGSAADAMKALDAAIRAGSAGTD